MRALSFSLVKCARKSLLRNRKKIFMFKKSNTPGDKTPKQENKDNVSKAENAVNEAPLTAEKPSAEKPAAPSNEIKKS